MRLQANNVLQTTIFFQGWTALHFAASKGNSDLCRLLLTKVTNIDPTNRNLNTPLHLATANEHKEVVEILMNNSSKGVGMKDEDGRYIIVLLDCFL